MPYPPLHLGPFSHSQAFHLYHNLHHHPTTTVHSHHLYVYYITSFPSFSTTFPSTTPSTFKGLYSSSCTTTTFFLLSISLQPLHFFLPLNIFTVHLLLISSCALRAFIHHFTFSAIVCLLPVHVLYHYRYVPIRSPLDLHSTVRTTFLFPPHTFVQFWIVPHHPTTPRYRFGFYRDFVTGFTYLVLLRPAASACHTALPDMPARDLHAISLPCIVLKLPAPEQRYISVLRDCFYHRHIAICSISSLLPLQTPACFFSYHTFSIPLCIPTATC